VFHSDGRRFPRRWERALFRLVGFVRERLRLHVRVRDGRFTSTYACENVLDALRSMSLWIKEEGTMRWIDAETKPGDVFMDIGANIGIYTIAAAHRVGAAGLVYAFEPHKVNALSLMRNVQLTGLSERVKVFACPLSDTAGVVAFNYASLKAASTASQLGHTRLAGCSEHFEPVACELVLASTVDALMTAAAIRPPTLVKIDVDGNELGILRGMRILLCGPSRPRALQVELNVGEQDRTEAFLRECGYTLSQRHFTYAGQRALSSGKPLAQVAHNAIFRPSQEYQP
jgi:FkbM family methyltransferase